MPMRIAIGACAEAGDCNTNVAQRHAASEMMRMMASRSAKIFKPDGLRPLTKEFPLFMHRQQQCPLWVKSRHLRCKRACPLYPRKQTYAVQKQKCLLWANSGHVMQRLV